jgi:hypothetical protein
MENKKLGKIEFCNFKIVSYFDVRKNIVFTYIFWYWNGDLVPAEDRQLVVNVRDDDGDGGDGLLPVLTLLSPHQLPQHHLRKGNIILKGQ